MKAITMQDLRDAEWAKGPMSAWYYIESESATMQDIGALMENYVQWRMRQVQCQGCDVPKDGVYQISEPMPADKRALMLSVTAREPFKSQLKECAARIAELESQLAAIGAGGVEPLRKPAAAPQAVQAAVPDGWVPCVITYEGQHPEEIAYGPQVMMNRLKKWLDRYFEMRTAPAHPAEGVPAPVTVVDALQSLIEAIQFTPLGVRQIHAMERAREALAATHPTQQGLDVRDASRYRFASKQDNFCDFVIHAFGCYCDDKESADRVIDAALAAQAKQGEQP